MTARIEGTRFDAEAPRTKCIAESETEDLYVTDFGYRHERLYRTGGGRLILVGEGGADTSWATYDETGASMAGRGYVRLTEREAELWAAGEDYWDDRDPRIWRESAAS